MLNAETILSRALARRALGCPYAVVLVYEHIWTFGPLAGLGRVDVLPFCSAETAERWVERINARNDRGQNEYRVGAFGVHVQEVAS